MRFAIDLTDERKVKVYEELGRGSDPRKSFFLLVAVSTMIASLGLVMNSTAVVIGAMLVAPLMTPILGLALALVRGDMPLLGLALRSEVLGVSVSILAAALFGYVLPTYFEATPEMLSRTTPNLLDLMVAVFAGLAGAYALVDEKISPVLPGVAISTAIVPPLANSGISLALGAYAGAWGSFLLFFTNFLSILLVASLVFSLAGMAENLQLRAGITIVRRFGVAVTGFVVITAILSSELLTMFENTRLRKHLTQALQYDLVDQRISDIKELTISRTKDRILVLAQVNGPTVIEPSTVKRIQQDLQEQILEPVELFVRTNITHDVSASGSINQAVAESLDGFFVPEQSLDSRIITLQKAEQAIREILDQKIGLHLVNLEAYPSGDRLTLIAEISGTRNLGTQEILEIEKQIQNVLPGIQTGLLVNHITSRLKDRYGGVRSEFSIPVFSHASADIGERVSEYLKTWLSGKTFWLDAWSMTYLDETFHFLFELKGPALFTKEEYKALKKDLKDAFNVPVNIYVRTELETVLGPEGDISLQDLFDDYRQRNSDAYQEETRRLVEEAR